MPVAQPSVSQTPAPPLKFDGETCPLCEQPIPFEKSPEINKKIEDALDAQSREAADLEKAARVAGREAALAELGEQLAKEKQEKEAAKAARKELEEQHKADEARRLQEHTKNLEKLQESLHRKHLKSLAEEREKTASERKELKAGIKTALAAAEQVKEDAAKREASVLDEAKKAALAESKDQLAKARLDQSAAEEAKKALEQKQKSDLQELLEQHQLELHNQRSALENDRLKAVSKEQAQAFKDRQRLERDIEKLKRQVQAKSAADRGEGAEVDLFEDLQEAFPTDRIRRIGKGEPGADIWHDVVQNGEACGRIVYDSKDHKQWRTSFVEKLRADQLGAEADHAVLSTRILPSGKDQICHEDEIVVANPARVVAIVHLLRQHIVSCHRLRLSGEQREKKTAELYEFINSDRCEQLLRRWEEIADKLLELDAKERKAHERMWTNRGGLLRALEKSHSDFRSEIDQILRAGGC